MVKIKQVPAGFLPCKTMETSRLLIWGGEAREVWNEVWAWLDFMHLRLRHLPCWPPPASSPLASLSHATSGHWQSLPHQENRLSAPQLVSSCLSYTAATSWSPAGGYSIQEFSHLWQAAPSSKWFRRGPHSRKVNSIPLSLTNALQIGKWSLQLQASTRLIWEGRGGAAQHKTQRVDPKRIWQDDRTKKVTLEALMPLDVRPPLSAPDMAPDARINAIFFLPSAFVKVFGESLAYFFIVTCRRLAYCCQYNWKKALLVWHQMPFLKRSIVEIMA